MKNKILPIILMIWPYAYFLYMLFPAGTVIYNNFTAIYIASTVLVYGANVWNALRCCDRENAKDYVFWNMIIKLFHIPFYIGVFALGVIFLLAMVVPALTLISPFIIMILAIIDYMLLLTSSTYGIRTIILFAKSNEVSKLTAALYVILHLFFVLDVLAAIMLYRKTRKIQSMRK